MCKEVGLEKEKCRDIWITRDTEGYHKFFIAHILVLLWLNLSYYWESTGKLMTERISIRRFNGNFEKSEFFEKLGQVIGRQIAAQRFTLSKTMDSGKIH